MKEKINIYEIISRIFCWQPWVSNSCEKHRIVCVVFCALLLNIVVWWGFRCHYFVVCNFTSQCRTTKKRRKLNQWRLKIIRLVYYILILSSKFKLYFFPEYDDCCEFNVIFASINISKILFIIAYSYYFNFV